MRLRLSVVVGIGVTLMLLFPILYASYYVPRPGDEPTITLLVIDQAGGPDQPLPRVLGTSVDWPDNANGLLYDDESGLLNPASVGELIGLEPSHLRFPATGLSQLYDWTQGVGTKDERGSNPTHGPKPQRSYFGTDEFYRLVDHTRSKAVMVVNANTGTPLMAADWVSYCNDRSDEGMGRERAANGYPAPYNIDYWEVGNEPYLPRYWKNRGYSTEGAGTRYAEDLKNFSREMKTIDPSIEIGAWMVLHPDMELTSADRSWNLNFLDNAHGRFTHPETGKDLFYFDYVVVKAYLPGIDMLLNSNDLYEYSYAQVHQSIRDDLAQIRGLLKTLTRSSGVPIAIASFEPCFGDEGWNTQAPANAGSALITADLAMQVLDNMVSANQTINYACYGELNTPTYPALMINPDFEAAHVDSWRRSPNYHAFQLCAQLQGGRPLGVTDLGSMTFSVLSELELQGFKDVPLVSAMATLHSKDGSMTMLLVNRDLSRSIHCSIKLEVGALTGALELQVRTIDFESILSNNLAGDRVTSPLPAPSEKRTVAASDVSVTIPPACVILVTLEPKGVA